MNWYYVDGNQQRGPITEAELENLHSTGKVLNDTLVWHDGAANWMPYAQVKGAGVPAGGGVACAECGGIFPPDEVIKFGDSHVCGNCKPVFMQKVREGVAPIGGALNYAGFWIRFAAYILDAIITGAMGGVIGFIIGFAARPDTQEGLAIVQNISSGVGFLLGLAYYVFFNGKFGATPGKMVCGLKIVTAEGYPISYARALGRYFAAILSAIICLIGYIMAAFDDEKRTLHDRICNTRVVKK